jgi:phage-related protein
VTLTQAILIAFTGAICALLACYAIWRAYNWATDYAARRIEIMLRDALARPARHHADIDAEYRQLVLDAHNRGDA